jgi:hypothetical protein
MKKIIFFFLVLCSLSANARSLYLVELKIWKDETFSLFNLKNERNAIELELPIDKDLFNSIKEGDVLQNNSVYKGAFDILPEFFKTFKIKVISKRIKKINNLERDVENLKQSYSSLLTRVNGLDSFCKETMDSINNIFFEDKKDEFDKAKKAQEQRLNDNANVFSWDEEE